MERSGGGGSVAGPVRVPPSRRKMLCGYKGCHYNGQKRSFKVHNATRHGGKPIVFRNDAFGCGGRWRNWVASNADVNFDVTENDNCDDPSLSLSTDADATSSNPTATTEARPNSCDEGEIEIGRGEAGELGRRRKGTDKFLKKKTGKVRRHFLPSSFCILSQVPNTGNVRPSYSSAEELYRKGNEKMRFSSAVLSCLHLS